MTCTLNIVARTNGVGLDQDVEIIRRAARAAGFEVEVSHCRSILPFAHWLPRRPRFDATIFLERLFPRWFGSSRVNILIPNQERFPRRQLPWLRKIDHVFCKSRHAMEVFEEHHPSCRFTGFTSRDLFDAAVERDEKSVLHLAGRSTLKGTETVLELWKRHPEWPRLTVVQSRGDAPDTVPGNVELIDTYLGDEEIKRLCNAHPIHLCPSLSEGWGHYIVEAMSCGAVVIATDGPPMNELVRPDRGVLVGVVRSEPRHLGTNFHVDIEQLEAALEQVWSAPPDVRAGIGDAARQWALANHEEFEKRLVDALENALCGRDRADSHTGG